MFRLLGLLVLTRSINRRNLPSVKRRVAYFYAAMEANKKKNSKKFFLNTSNEVEKKEDESDWSAHRAPTGLTNGNYWEPSGTIEGQVASGWNIRSDRSSAQARPLHQFSRTSPPPSLSLSTPPPIHRHQFELEINFPSSYFLPYFLPPFLPASLSSSLPTENQ